MFTGKHKCVSGAAWASSRPRMALDPSWGCGGWRGCCFSVPLRTTVADGRFMLLELLNWLSTKKKHSSSYINNRIGNKAVGSTGSPGPWGWEVSNTSERLWSSLPPQTAGSSFPPHRGVSISLASRLLISAIHSTRGKYLNLSGPH